MKWEQYTPNGLSIEFGLKFSEGYNDNNRHLKKDWCGKNKTNLGTPV